MFKMTLNQNEGVLLVSYSGYFTIYDVKLFQRDLLGKLQIIRPEDYVLVIDMQEVRLSTPDLAPLLDEIKRIYSEAPFKAVYMVESDVWMTERPKRKDAARANWATVPSIDEALSRMKTNIRPPT